jgi:hypothetical protein
VHFNSKGAVIVEDSQFHTDGHANEIYFPNHTAEVSHIAVDVCPLEMTFMVDWWVIGESGVFHTGSKK